MDQVIIGGIEGGSSHSTIVLLNSHGKVICKCTGLSTNHFLLGMTETRKRIADMVAEAKRQAHMPEEHPLTALGLSLSGCEQEETNQELVRGFLEQYPRLSERYAIGSDTQGPVAAMSNTGGIVCIAGTGSNTLLLNPDGTKVQCGGWGYLLSDEGSAWSIAHRAIKICFEEQDNYQQPPHPTARVLQVIKEHFQVKALVDLLEHFYTKFEKAKIASLCKKMSVLAREGDDLCKAIFREAGEQLARSIGAVAPKASPELLEEGGLHVVCVGSVWLSFDLLKDGFLQWLRHHTNIAELILIKLMVPYAVGAAYMAADQLHISLPRDYKSNYQVFFHYNKRGSSITEKNGGN